MVNKNCDKLINETEYEDNAAHLCKGMIEVGNSLKIIK